MTAFRFFLPVAAVALAFPAAAQDRTVTVVYGDLDLASPAGQSRLDQRIAAALDQVCEVGFESNLRHQRASRTCRIDSAARLGQVRVLVLEQARNRPASLASSQVTLRTR